MHAYKKAEKIIEKDITKPHARVLSNLIISLESEVEFDIRSLYDLNHDEFELTIEILKEWRFSRHYMSKSKAFSSAYYAHGFLDESKKFLLKAETKA
jgi:hypothetical protein